MLSWLRKRSTPKGPRTLDDDFVIIEPETQVTADSEGPADSMASEEICIHQSSECLPNTSPETPETPETPKVIVESSEVSEPIEEPETFDNLVSTFEEFIQRILTCSDAISQQTCQDACYISDKVVKQCSESIMRLTSEISDRIRIISEAESRRISERLRNP